MLSESFFWKLGHKYTDHKLHLSRAIGLRRFKNLHGVTPNICNVIWSMIETNLHESCEPKHLLWTLCFLKQYNSDSTNGLIFGADEKTIRKYVWLFIDDLDVIKFEERLLDVKPGQRCFVSLDGVDFKIFEPTPFDRKFYSHKIKASAFSYEIGLCLMTGHIVWGFGGYPAVEYPDLKLSRELYTQLVMPGELTLADKGYNDRNFYLTPDQTNPEGHKYVMSRHETVNKRLRQFRILYDTFRHQREKHKICFDAVINITALILNWKIHFFQFYNFNTPA